VDGVAEVARCRLSVGDGCWGFEEANGLAIAEHWRRRQGESPRMFNGTVFVLSRWSLEHDVFIGTFTRTSFAAFLYWREQSYPEAYGRDCFGCAFLRSAEGHALLGRQHTGQLNSGLAYPPSGFLDPSDVLPDGTIDIDANIGREIGEETGLDPRQLDWRHGYRIVFSGSLVAIARELRSPLASSQLRQAVLRHIAAETTPELADVLMVATAAGLGADIPDYARLLLASTLPAA
jgi:hypothetical protein